MPLEVTELSELAAADVQANHEVARQLLREDNPTLDVVGGAFDETTVYYGSVLATVNQQNLTLLDRSGSMWEINNDPALADDEAVDKVLSNFNMERKTGSAASGTVKIVVSQLKTITVSNGAVFTAGGREFITEQSYVARTSAENIIADSDRVLTPTPDGNYAFTVEVVDSATGAAGQITKDTLMTAQQPPLYFVKALAASDFTGGTDTESNAQLVARLPEGPAVKALSGPTTMKATLRAREAFANVLQSSIIGMGDAEMLRDKHWIWPSGGGGRVDWYIRTQERIQRLLLAKTATLIEKTSDGFGIWQFSLDRDEFPGFYEVYSVQPENGAETSGTYEIISDTRAYDISGDDVPDITTVAEAVYSRYQTAVIQFKDDETETEDLTVDESTQDYDVTLSGLPLIGDIQDDLGSRTTCNAAGDLLVKAPAPCFLKLSFTLEVPVGSAEPVTADIADALASVVNNYGFAGRLPASILTDTIHNYLSTDSSVSAVDMFGRIRRPDGTTKYVRNSTLLTVPSEPENMITGRTTVFFLDPEDVSISVQAISAPDV